MSDIKLFRTSEQVTEIGGTSVSVEKSLQDLIERYLETFLGVRFLASEYSTGRTHGGRIDTLGIDENNCPVIIEYKRAMNENVMNQGLFYLDWLLDHKAEFQLIVMEKFGVEAANEIEWSTPRLLCIAGDFTKYDQHAVQQINRNIELIRYKRYGNDLLMLELVNATSTGTEIAERWKRLAAKDIDEKLEIVAESDFKNVLKNRMKELADVTLSKCLPIPEKKETSKAVDLKTAFLSWVSTFRLKTELEQNAEAIVAAIQNNQIPGFEWNGTHLYFDEVGTFGFAFVDETAVFDHILAHIKPMVEEKPAEVVIDSSNVVSLENKRNQLNFEDILEEWHLVEVKEQTKKKRGKKTYSGQLALDLFDL